MEKEVLHSFYLRGFLRGFLREDYNPVLDASMSKDGIVGRQAQHIATHSRLEW